MAVAVTSGVENCIFYIHALRPSQRLVRSIGQSGPNHGPENDASVAQSFEGGVCAARAPAWGHRSPTLQLRATVFATRASVRDVRCGFEVVVGGRA